MRPLWLFLFSQPTLCDATRSLHPLGNPPSTPPAYLPRMPQLCLCIRN